MNSLIIIAHPKKDSFSFAMANKYKEEANLQGHKVELIDLYRCKHKQDFFTFEDANDFKPTTEMEYFQSKIKEADELVFIFPYWWGGMPAIMKNFIDWNFSHGFAFENGEKRPIGLLTNKTAKVFTTTGAPSFIYKITGANRRLKKMFKQQIFDFCGIKITSFKIFGGIIKDSPLTKNILNKIS